MAKKDVTITGIDDPCRSNTVRKTNVKVIERDIVVNGTHIHVKSIFNGSIPLEKALGNIAKSKLSASEKNGSHH